ncbi:unnamed protein product [Adineta ricciae]|uniref:Apple domain-containing protein n=1 Tax=Adineta ricciae TaxID=249248 RepID=A0A815ZEJ3_ADIRI|nr:unnamed protein product [Adineta ricciae]CAF1584036.1 unnamed protein product [Adineta ricciae]
MTCLSELFLLLFITPLATQNIRTLELSHLNNTLYTCSDPQCSPSTLVTVSNIRHCQIVCLVTTECRTVVFYHSNSQCQLFVDIATNMGTLSIQMGVETMIAIDNRKLSAPTTSTTTTTTANPYLCSNMTILAGYNMPGDDITSQILDSYALCCQWCLTYSGCVAFIWGVAGVSTSRCYLKNAIPDFTVDSELISAHY